MTSAGCQFSMSLSDMRKEIECDLCQISNPLKRCSRCHITHYCSIECQKLDWKAHKPLCIPLEETKKKMADGTNDEEMKKFIALSNIDSLTPLEKAEIYSKVGRLTDIKYDHHFKTKQDTVDGTSQNPKVIVMDDEQEMYCNLAMEQINEVLNSDPVNAVGLIAKGNILRYVRPLDAIDALHEVLRRDEEMVTMTENIHKAMAELAEFRDSQYNKLTTAEKKDIDHPVVRELTKQDEALETLKSETKRVGVQVNSGPFRLYPIKIYLAQAYESAGEYEKAVNLYVEMIKETYDLYCKGFGSVSPHVHRQIKINGSRCFFAMKRYADAKKLAQMALDINRHVDGIHVVLAQAQWAANEKKEAIRTMCRGVIYETPWDETNIERNRVYLQECLDAMSGTSHTETDIRAVESSQHNVPHVNN